jgi:hypothetical protein
MPAKKKYTSKSKRSRSPSKKTSRKAKPTSKLSKKQSAHFLHLMFGDKSEEE